MNGGFNDQPEYWREINESFFGNTFMGYIFKPYVFRQITKTYSGDKIPMLPVKIWEVRYKGWENMGLAMSYDFNKGKISYYVFGSEERWKKNQEEFAAQFVR